jgi:soluble lytic murein transglycosylase-like protein
MRRRLLLLMVLATLAPHCFAQSGTTPVSQNQASWGLRGIVPLRDDQGRTIYVDDPTSKPTSYSSQPLKRVLVYWSRVEHRWKPVPGATPMAVRAAKSAAAEVNALVANAPSSPVMNTSESDASPDNREILRGRAMTSAELDSIIEEAARRHDVDPNLVRALIKVESNYDAHAVSRKGAMGLMQLMPSTARTLNVSNPFDPQQNVDGGVRHLKHLLQDFNGDVKLSLAAYNAGAGAVARSNGVPPYSETRNYVRRITALYGDHGKLLNGPSADPIRVSRDANGVLTFSNTD